MGEHRPIEERCGFCSDATGAPSFRETCPVHGNVTSNLVAELHNSLCYCPDLPTKKCGACLAADEIERLTRERQYLSDECHRKFLEIDRLRAALLAIRDIVIERGIDSYVGEAYLKHARDIAREALSGDRVSPVNEGQNPSAKP